MTNLPSLLRARALLLALLNGLLLSAFCIPSLAVIGASIGAAAAPGLLVCGFVLSRILCWHARCRPRDLIGPSMVAAIVTNAAAFLVGGMVAAAPGSSPLATRLTAGILQAASLLALFVIAKQSTPERPHAASPIATPTTTAFHLLLGTGDGSDWTATAPGGPIAASGLDFFGRPHASVDADHGHGSGSSDVGQGGDSDFGGGGDYGGGGGHGGGGGGGHGGDFGGSSFD